MDDKEYREYKNEIQKMNKRIKELREAGIKYDTNYKIPLSLAKSTLAKNADIARAVNADPRSYQMYYRKVAPKETYYEKKQRQKEEKAKYRREKKEAKKKEKEDIKRFGIAKTERITPKYKTKKERKQEEYIIAKANRRARELEQLKLEKKSEAYQTQKSIQRKRLKQKYGDKITQKELKKFYDAPLKFTSVEDAKRFLNEKTSQAERTYAAIHKTFSTIRARDKSGILQSESDEQILMLLIERDNGRKFKNKNYGSDIALNEYKIMLKEFKHNVENDTLTPEDMEIMKYINNNKYSNMYNRARRR